MSEPVARDPWWLRIDEGIAVVSLVVTVGSVVWGVVTRYLFPQPAAWTYEVATMAFAWTVFFGAATGVRRGLHADIDIFVHYLPERWQKVIDIGNWVLLAVFFAAMGVLFAQLAASTTHVYTVALSLPQTVTYAPLALACLMMLLYHLGRWGRWRATNPEDVEDII
jgi:TRAP-type C4-dicarboxylate transport system permease small subunit